jgi:hypothetical protein
MATFNELLNTETNPHHKAIFEIIAKHESGNAETEDGYKEIALDASELGLIKDEMSQIVQDARASAGSIQSASDMRSKLITDFPAKLKKQMETLLAQEKLAQNKGIVQDGYASPVSGIGTAIDPGMNVDSFIPVSILPNEATAYYSNGGIPARIINKKAGCLSLDGVHFECADFSPEDITELEDYAGECGFSEAYAQSITQSLIFGGAVAYPVLDGDNPLTTQLTLEQIKAKMGNKTKFIRYWVTADRWNCVFVPDYNITAQDYLYARTLFIPLGGVRVSTDRMAMVRPQKLPFWGAIQQMGWSTSDFEGWIKDFEAYQIMKMSLPIMAQQSSLMYHAIPADGLIIENGAEYARQFFKENEAQMREWSMLHPRTINSVGEIKILERTYSGYKDLLKESELALCASSGVAESILFEEKATGLASDNREDVTLKQSEMIRLLFNTVAPSFKNCIELLVCSCFGADSEQAKHAKSVKIKADNGFVLSEVEKSQLGQAFSSMAGQFTAMGIPLTTAVKIAQKFVPSAEIDDATMEALGAGEAEGMDQQMWDAMNAGRDMDDNDMGQFPMP